MGGSLIWNAIRRRSRVRKIEDTPRSKVESAPQGYVELQGFAWPKEQTIRGMSGDELIYYSLKVQRLESKGSGKNRTTEWVTRFTHSHSRPFYLVDATGLALVDVESGEVDIADPRKTEWPRLSSKEKIEVLRLTAGRMIPGFPPPDFLFGIFGSKFRIVESAIPVGSPLYAHGDFRTLQQDTPQVAPLGLTEFHSRVFDHEARGVRNLQHFLDKNRDGKVTAEEARHGYAFAAGRARANKPQASQDGEKSFPVFGKMGSSPEHPLLLADLHEGHLLERKGRFVWLEFIGGAILIALAVAALI